MSNSIERSPQYIDNKTLKKQQQKNSFSSEILVCGRNYSHLYYQDDSHGQLGLGQKFDINQERTYQIMKVCNYNLFITQISCGLNHTAFLTQKGHIYTIGNNEYGKLGINYKEINSSSTPCFVESLQNYKCIQVVCGENHTMVLTNQGTIFTWGYNKFGQLGTSTQSTLYSSNPIEPFIGQNIQAKSINAGNNHSLFITNENYCFSAGDNQYGQLGIKQKCQYASQFQKINLNDQIFQVSGGINYTLFLNMRGQVFGSGNNSFGQLGIGHRRQIVEPQLVSTENQIIFQQIATGYHSAGVSQQGELYIWGTGIFGEYLSPTKFLKINQKIKFVSIGYQFGAVIDQIGQVWTWGSNEYGQLGIGDFLHRSTPFPVSAIKKKNVSQLSCGNNFLICLCSDQTDKLVKEDFKQYTEAKVNPQLNESYINHTASNKKQKKSQRTKSEANEKLIKFNVEPSKLVKELEIKLVEEMDEKKKLVDEIKKLRNQTGPSQYQDPQQQELIQCIETYENQYELIKQQYYAQQEQLTKDQQDNKILKMQVIQLNEQLQQQHQTLVDLTNQKQNIYTNDSDRKTRPQENYIKKIQELNTEINMLQQIIQTERQDNKKHKQKIKNLNNIILQQKNALKFQENQNLNCDQAMLKLQDKQINQNSNQLKSNQLENNIMNLQQQLRQNQTNFKYQSEKKTVCQDENIKLQQDENLRLLNEQKYDSISIIPTFSTQQKRKKDTQFTDYSNLIGSDDLQLSCEFDSSLKYSNKTRQFIQKNSLNQSQNEPTNQIQKQQKNCLNNFNSPEKLNKNIDFNHREQLLQQYKLNIMQDSIKQNVNDPKSIQNQLQSRPKSMDPYSQNNKFITKNCENRYSLNPFDNFQELSSSFRKRQRQTSNVLCNISNSDLKFQQNQDNQYKYYNK